MDKDPERMQDLGRLQSGGLGLGGDEGARPPRCQHVRIVTDPEFVWEEGT